MCQGNVGFQYQGAIAFLCRGQFPYRHHARDVGGAFFVLAARVNQQQTIALYLGKTLLSGMVMRQSAIFIEACDGGKTLTDEAQLLRAIFQQFFGDGQFGNVVLVFQSLF